MTAKPSLLFLCHRIPFPPNKGDKIRSFNMLKALSQHFEVHLGAFVDDDYDWQYADKLDHYCVSKKLIGQHSLTCKIKGLRAFLTGQAISLPYYASGEMQRWVDQVVAAKNIQHVFVYSSVMAQFVASFDDGSMRRVVDFVDVDSDKWRQYAEGKSGIASWVYRREWKTLASFENEVAAQCDHALFVSPQEADLFRQQLPAAQHHKVKGVLNGVDTDYFNPDADIRRLPDDSPDVVFTGAMDYWANVDAVLWFCETAWPEVRKRFPHASLYIVGGNPTSKVKELAKQPGVVVTGRVEDVRPYILQSKVVVAPLQIARGIQNKVLEGMAMAKPVVATSMAMEGIAAENDFIDVKDTPETFAQAVMDRIANVSEAPVNRQWIEDNLEWDATLAVLPMFFSGEDRVL